MRIIKLRDLLHELQIKEAPVADLPPQVKFVMPPAHHAYAKAAGDSAGKPYTQPNVDFSEKPNSDDVSTRAANVIKQFENSKDNRKGGFDKKLKKWLPHKSLEGGSDTIAYGHKIQPNESAPNKTKRWKDGLTDSEALKLLEKDIQSKVTYAKKHIKNFDNMPITVKIATVNALYRGDMGPNTMNLLSQNNFRDAAKEYLNHREYKTTANVGVKKRMDWNAAVFKAAG